MAELSSVPDAVCVPLLAAGVCIPGKGWSRACPPGSAARHLGAPSPRSNGQQWLPSRIGPRPQKWWTSLRTRIPGANTSCNNAVSLCSAPSPPALPGTDVHRLNHHLQRPHPWHHETQTRSISTRPQECSLLSVSLWMVLPSPRRIPAQN